MNELIESVAERLLNVYRARIGFSPCALSKMTKEHKAEWINDARDAILATLEGVRELNLADIDALIKELKS